MAHPRKTLAISVAALGLALGACADDDTADRTADTVGNPDSAWVNFREEFEDLVDVAATGDSGAQELLLEQCRQTVGVVRKADHPGAERVDQLCDNIRDADDETAWNDVRWEFEKLNVTVCAWVPPTRSR